jgi:hypothetical protein
MGATAGCRFVLHVASPFVTTKPKDPEDLIRPAVQGTTRQSTRRSTQAWSAWWLPRL